MDEIKEGLQELREKLDLNDEQVIILVATAAAAVVGTLVICGLCCRGGSRKVKKRADGKGPTGDGKAKLYHSKRLRSSRVAWLIQGLLNFQRCFNISSCCVHKFHKFQSNILQLHCDAELHVVSDFAKDKLPLVLFE